MRMEEHDKRRPARGSFKSGTLAPIDGSGFRRRACMPHHAVEPRATRHIDRHMAAPVKSRRWVICANISLVSDTASAHTHQPPQVLWVSRYLLYRSGRTVSLRNVPLESLIPSIGAISVCVTHSPRFFSGSSFLVGERSVALRTAAAKGWRTWVRKSPHSVPLRCHRSFELMRCQHKESGSRSALGKTNGLRDALRQAVL
jgi:hypothetical protein